MLPAGAAPVKRRQRRDALVVPAPVHHRSPGRPPPAGGGTGTGTTAVVSRSPGRVNLIGDHTDYCGGLALPMAIDLGIEIRLDLDGSRRLELTSDVDARPAVIDVGAPADPEALTRRTPPWSRLAAAVTALARPASGGVGSVRSTVPAGAGLSSSAAFSVALALALGAGPDPVPLARRCQQAEAAAGSDVGLLDFLCVAGAREGHAMLVDFSTLGTSHVPVPREVEVVVVHSGVSRRLDRTPYALRRRECAAAEDRLGISLGRAGASDVGTLGDPVLRRRARHVVSECGRVREVAGALAGGDLAVAGRAMVESHHSLASDFEASVPEVDALVCSLTGLPGVYGARMTGGGWGGCVVALARPGTVDPARWPGRCWLVRPSAGATVDALEAGAAGAQRPVAARRGREG
ncbi:MAG: galactokinase [Acidimicrobiales bacterium]